MEHQYSDTLYYTKSLNHSLEPLKNPIKWTQYLIL